MSSPQSSPPAPAGNASLLTTCQAELNRLLAHQQAIEAELAAPRGCPRRAPLPRPAPK